MVAVKITVEYVSTFQLRKVEVGVEILVSSVFESLRRGDRVWVGLKWDKCRPSKFYPGRGVRSGKGRITRHISVGVGFVIGSQGCRGLLG